MEAACKSVGVKECLHPNLSQQGMSTYIHPISDNGLHLKMGISIEGVVNQIQVRFCSNSFIHNHKQHFDSFQLARLGSPDENFKILAEGAVVWHTHLSALTRLLPLILGEIREASEQRMSAPVNQLPEEGMEVEGDTASLAHLRIHVKKEQLQPTTPSPSQEDAQTTPNLFRPRYFFSRGFART
ncbi:MAG: hypothetical protein GY737_26685 [Desulfobacteraceae bacterium]|nr:hypothetical protein [Desulfobacteraceae bacterium]